MRPVPSTPAVHLFVCVNRRPEGAPLGAGCGDAGDAVYDELKDEVAKRRAFGAVWVTRTLCLGVCPKRGCTVAIYPRQRLVTEVERGDAAALFQGALAEAKS